MEVFVTLLAVAGLVLHIKGAREAWVDWAAVKGRSNGRLRRIAAGALRNEGSRIWIKLLWTAFGVGAMLTPRPALRQVIVFEQFVLVVVAISLVTWDINGYLDRLDRRKLLAATRLRRKL